MSDRPLARTWAELLKEGLAPQYGSWIGDSTMEQAVIPKRNGTQPPPPSPVSGVERIPFDIPQEDNEIHSLLEEPNMPLEHVLHTPILQPHELEPLRNIFPSINNDTLTQWQLDTWRMPMPANQLILLPPQGTAVQHGTCSYCLKPLLLQVPQQPCLFFPAPCCAKRLCCSPENPSNGSQNSVGSNVRPTNDGGETGGPQPQTSVGPIPAANVQAMAPIVARSSSGPAPDGQWPHFAESGWHRARAPTSAPRQVAMVQPMPFIGCSPWSRPVPIASQPSLSQRDCRLMGQNPFLAGHHNYNIPMPMLDPNADFRRCDYFLAGDANNESNSRQLTVTNGGTGDGYIVRLNNANL
ncbi:uncharacterized protein LOC117588696 [Drosophila guanche]|uniref:Uncharacterized protein n=1 Tax=Drosophila guanche TaxID=7266 RepID=A0A3B0KJL6_DROGU|nr:uncharacterized protein LOC117588696 [Drosophila guanche]SPP86679.1 Hypothetical predicted protein [Drosophila guanche]